MFDGVARGYDRTNTLLTLGTDRLWRRATRRTLSPRPGERVLDLAAGTGVSTVELGKSGAWCVAADFSAEMLRAGAWRGAAMVVADATRLPFPDAAFDGVGISFGLRNISAADTALGEVWRVLRPGGRLVICEFSTLSVPVLRTMYSEYLMGALPWVARRVSSNPEAYVYLAESIRAWPDQKALAGMIEKAGFTEVTWQNLTLGVVALHRGVKP